MSVELYDSNTLGPGPEDGSTKLAYVLDKHFWGQGYGTEAVRAVVHGYVPLLKQQGYMAWGHPLTKIVATVRSDNPASIKLLHSLKFVKSEEPIVQNGQPRYLFSLVLK